MNNNAEDVSRSGEAVNQQRRPDSPSKSDVLDKIHKDSAVWDLLPTCVSCKKNDGSVI